MSRQTLTLADLPPSVLTQAVADAKGDLLAASAPDAVGRLALGANGQVLMADGAQALGVKWAVVWVQMTQAAYDALGTKDPNTLYVVIG